MPSLTAMEGAMPSNEHEAIVEAMASQPTPETPPTLEESRAGMEAQFADQPLPEGTTTDAVDADGVPAEWISTSGSDPSRVILGLHGGGYVLGSIATHRGHFARVSEATGARCLVIDYRLAPEHPFPAAVEDASRAYRWLRASGVDANRIAIVGDSAGGGLTLGTLVALRDAGDVLPAAAVCLSPWTDMDLDSNSMRNADDPLLTLEAIQGMADSYLQGGDARDPRAAPLHADYAGFPPLLIQVGTRELLLDDATRVAEKARAQGVDVTLEKGEGLIHVWHLFGPHIPESVEAYGRIGAFVRKHV